MKSVGTLVVLFGIMLVFFWSGFGILKDDPLLLGGTILVGAVIGIVLGRRRRQSR